MLEVGPNVKKSLVTLPAFSSDLKMKGIALLDHTLVIINVQGFGVNFENGILGFLRYGRSITLRPILPLEFLHQ